MKKILSLVCALVLIVLGANAASTVTQGKAKVAPRVAMEQMKKASLDGANLKLEKIARIERDVFQQNKLSLLDQRESGQSMNNRLKLDKEAGVKSKGVVAKPRSITSRKQATVKTAYTTIYNYKCGPTEVVVTDLSTPTYNQFKLEITQKAKNTTEYNKETLYDNTVTLILNPDEHSIAGTFTSDDYSIDLGSFVKYNSYTRYVSSWETSTITIESKGGNKYAITDGKLAVENNSGTYLYNYNYCYDVADLNDQTAEKIPFEFTFDEGPEIIPVTVAQYSAKYYASSKDWQVIMYDAAGNGYSFDIFAPAEGIESGKTYTSDNSDFDLDYTFAVINKVQDAAVAASYTQTETEDALSVTAEMTTAGNKVYQFTYTLDKTVEVKDANGIIIQPAKGEVKEYNRLGTNTCFYINSYGQKGMTYQSGTATLVECADGTVYWKNPVSNYTNGAWIKGKKEGETITFATKQPVAYNSNYNATLSVRWGYYNTKNWNAADSYAGSFILDIKGDSLIMRGTQATTGSTETYFPGIFWDDDNTFQGYGDCGVNLYIPGWTPSKELITPPAGLVTAKMPFTGSGASENYADSVLVGWDKDTVYIQGLAVDFPTAWIKGVLKEGVVTFEKFQYVGMYNGTMPIWVLGTNAESELLDFTMTYDAQANLFKATNIFVVNASYEKIYYLDMVSKIVIGEVPQADWGEWEDFAPFGYNTGTWTFTVMANSPQSYNNYVALVRTDKNDADNKQIKITNWGEGWFGEGVELIINWNAKDNTCSIDKQYTGYTETQYGKVYVASVEDGTYNPETATFSIKVDYTVSAGSFGKDVETYVMDTKQPALMYDTDAPFDGSFTRQETERKYDNGYATIETVNATKQTMYLVLFTGTNEETIPAGTYVISDSYEAGTALKSAGVDEVGVTPCFAATIDEEGYYDFRFMVEGTITVADDGAITVDAKNSWGQPVTATIEAPSVPTGINDLKSNILQNGMQSGKVYNLRGQRVERMVKGQVYILDGKKFMAK